MQLNKYYIYIYIYIFNSASSAAFRQGGKQLGVHDRIISLRQYCMLLDWNLSK